MSSTKREVAVFGAGIAGLTAAHELIERGFGVTVYEPAVDLDGEGPAVGGLARTQWAGIELPAGPLLPPSVAPTLQSTQAPGPFRPVQVKFQVDQPVMQPESASALAAVVAAMTATPGLRLRIRGWCEDPGVRPGRLEDAEVVSRVDCLRAKAVKEYLTSHGIDAARLDVQALGTAYPADFNRSRADRAYVEVSSSGALVPGDHGYRFFPSFYRHLFDTMRRTPIAEPGPVFVESGRTALDNVVPTYSIGVLFEDGKSFVLPRRRITSVVSMMDLLRDGYAAMGFTAGDVARLNAKAFKYITSCSARRDTYETVSWWDFVEGPKYTERVQRYIDSSPQLLVAMRGRVSDARTIGNVAAQLLKDQVVESGRPDGTLSGPTTTAWLDHWERYLKHQGVRFEIGRLDGFTRDAGGVLPVVVTAEGQREVVMVDYVVVAVSVQAVHALVTAAPDLVGGDYDRIRLLGLGDGALADPGGTVDHLSGVQFYFDSAHTFLPGHTVFPDSDWGLSAIFQPQFWARQLGWWHGYRGMLSVDIGDFHTASRTTGKTAWESTRDEIATEVWRQIRSTLPASDPIPEPFLYHLDDNIEGEPGVGRRNATPFLINRTGEFRTRPGEPGGYAIHDGRVVFAGTYMQTYTRMTTMESANESGRHAVNAILAAEGFRGDACLVVDPERHEFQDLRGLVQLDEQLWLAGLPHLVDILRLDTYVDLLADPAALGAIVEDILRRYGLTPPSSDGIRLTV